MKHLEEAKRVSSCRHQRELHPAEASVPAAALLHLEASVPAEALRHLEALHLEEPRRLSSSRLPAALALLEASARLAGSRPAVSDQQEFDRERARRKVRLARARRRLQRASCLLGIRDQIFLASLFGFID
jgi:hypothetical protein